MQTLRSVAGAACVVLLMTAQASAQGLTFGQWRDVETKAIVKEPSKEVTLIVPAGAQSEIKASIEDIVTAYKQRFRQQSVGIVIKQACVSF